VTEKASRADVYLLNDPTAVCDLALGLGVLVDTQSVVSAGVPGAVTAEVTPDQVRTYAFALISEVVELCDAKDGKGLGWKPWATPKPVDPQYVAHEVADVLAFLGLILRYAMVSANLSVMDLAEAYRDKTGINVARIAGEVEGYGA
jgi:NTP pyrophosphatase (non-canonical NTP hydrolase)